MGKIIAMRKNLREIVKEEIQNLSFSTLRDLKLTLYELFPEYKIIHEKFFGYIIIENETEGIACRICEEKGKLYLEVKWKIFSEGDARWKERKGLLLLQYLR